MDWQGLMPEPDRRLLLVSGRKPSQYSHLGLGLLIPQLHKPRSDKRERGGNSFLVLLFALIRPAGGGGDIVA